MENRSAYANRPRADTAARCWVMKEIIGKQRMQIADSMAIEPHASRVVRQHLESRFVIEDHLRLFGFMPLGGLTEVEQAFGLKQ